jgi:ketosteroid isomerase-like protein
MEVSMVLPITLFLALLGTTAPLASSQNAKAQSTEAASQALVELENKWVDALAKSDIAALGLILADTYVDTDEQGHQTDREGLFSILKSGDLKVESIKLSDMHVHIYGDAALVTGKGVQAGSFKGQPINNTVVFTDTFVKRNGKWKAVASHRSVVA